MRLFIALFVLIGVSATAQITYYELPDGRIMDVFAFEKHKKSLSDGLVIHNTVSTRTTADSIINKVSVQVVDSNPDSSYYDPFAVHKKKIGQAFPAELLDEQARQLLELGQPVLINFWFTSCRPCVMEIPILNELAAEFDNEAQFVAITFDRASRVNQFLTRRAFDFYHATDARTAIDTIGVEAFPMNVLLDKNGIIRAVYGDVFSDRYNLSAQIRSLINE